MCSIFASRTFHIKMQMKADMSEEELSLQCQRGDMRARHTLYERYGGSLMAICLRYIGDRETAEDILHDGFLRIFQSIKQFSYQGEGSLKMMRFYLLLKRYFHQIIQKWIFRTRS